MLSANSRNKRYVELNAYIGGRSWYGRNMRAAREKVAIRQDLERCPVRVESRVMTVKGLYPIVSKKIRVRPIKIPMYTKVSRGQEEKD